MERLLRIKNLLANLVCSTQKPRGRVQNQMDILDFLGAPTTMLPLVPNHVYVYFFGYSFICKCSYQMAWAHQSHSMWCIPPFLYSGPQSIPCTFESPQGGYSWYWWHTWDTLYNTVQHTIHPVSLSTPLFQLSCPCIVHTQCALSTLQFSLLTTVSFSCPSCRAWPGV